MGKAARAIIIENNRMLVMRRFKQGVTYYTLVGGLVHADESIEQGLIREIKEETNLDITTAELVYTEMHPKPYNEQYIYLCTIAPHDSSIALQESSEENKLNSYSMQSNVHTPLWVDLSGLKALPFRTPQLQEAILRALKKGFPKEPITL